MNAFVVTLLTILLAALVTAVVLLRKRRGPSRKQVEIGAPIDEGASSGQVVKAEQPPKLLSSLQFGTDPSKPAVTLRPLPLADLDSAANVPTVQPSLGVTSRISALMQAAPSLLVAGAHQGRQLMEVVIDGKLIRAADGDGFRAMARDAKGFTEHARLYEAKDLSTLVNAAAVWQLASVVVAQKHMADISQKLSELKESVTRIGEFLEEQRRSKVKGAHWYLQQAHETISQGELSQSVRGNLERIELELAQVMAHLLAESNTRLKSVPTGDDTFGTASLHKNTVQKYSDLGRTLQDLALCLKTQALSWYVLSLFPGEEVAKRVRYDALMKMLEELNVVRSSVEAASQTDLHAFKSMWNRDKTLEARRGDVLHEAEGVKALLEASRTGISEQLETTQMLMIERDRPTQLIIELHDGEVMQVRQRELVAA